MDFSLMSFIDHSHALILHLLLSATVFRLGTQYLVFHTSMRWISRGDGLTSLSFLLKRSESGHYSLSGEI